MKYYAVTDDINELYHYGVKGMKWGQHLFGDDLRPKSAGYKKAATKLRSIMSKARNDVETWSDRHYKKQIVRAKKNAKDIKKKYGWDQVADDVRANERAYKEAQRDAANMDKAYRAQQKYNSRILSSQAKQAVKAAKAEKNFDRYLQDAREGHLHARNLSDEQIQRINERLNNERIARQLGGSEKMSYRKRRREAIREGKLEGYKKGTAAGMEALAKGVVEMGIRSKIVKDINNRSDARRQKVRNKIVNKKSWIDRRTEARRDLKDEAYKEKIRSEDYYNKNVFSRFDPTRRAAERLDQNKKLSEQKKLDNDIYRDAYKQWIKPGKTEKPKDYKKRIEDYADEMRDTMSAFSYKNPDDIGYHRKTIKEDAERKAKNIRSKVDKVVGAYGHVRSFFDAYPDYDTGKTIEEEPVTKAVSTQTSKSKSVPKNKYENSYTFKSTYSYPEAQELWEQLKRGPTPAEIKSVRRNRNKNKKG